MSWFKEKKILFAFILSLFVWTYLGATSRMSIANDALNYEDQARIIHEEGWIAFLKQGPLREPLYTASVAGSMEIAGRLGLPYQKVQTAFQIVLLFLTQLLLWRLLRLLRISPTVTALTLLYFGVSPAMLNAGFSLFSEIITIPLITLVILLTVRLWAAVLNSRLTQVLLLSFGTGLLAGITTLSKAILDYVFPLFLLPFAVLAVRALSRKNGSQMRTGLIAILFFGTAFGGTTGIYKALNLKYNGHFAITSDRGPHMLYHYAVRRTQPLTQERLMVGLLSIPGEKVCRSVLPEACHEWWWDNYSNAARKITQLRRAGIAEKELSSALMSSAMAVIGRNPLQYGLFTAFEAIKMLLWESTQVGYVRYPGWLQAVYNNPLIKNTLRLLVFFITSGALLWAGMVFWKDRTGLWRTESTQDRRIALLFFMLYFIFIFCAFYASIITIVRYAFPIVPLYLACIALAVDHWRSRKNPNRT